jgi:hypothetical protein
MVIAAPVVVLVVAMVALPRFSQLRRQSDSGSDFVPARLPHLASATALLNRGTFAPESLAGHPVVVVLWSDTDPRALAALPHAQSWWQAYARYGVRVLGVHSPEFAFAADPAVPRRITQRLHLTFPIALDPNYQIRNRFGDFMPWPGLAVADTAGRIVLQVPVDQPWEVDIAIRKLLRRLHPDIGFPSEPEPPEPPATSRAQGRTVALGAGRVHAGPLADARPGAVLTFTTQFRFQEEGVPFVPYPVGRWMPNAEGLVAGQAGAANFVAIRSGGERLCAIIGPPASGPARVWILADDAWLAAGEAGQDVQVDPQGASYVDVSEPRIYEIAPGGKARVFRFSPKDPGVTFYAFLFETPSAITPLKQRKAG